MYLLQKYDTLSGLDHSEFISKDVPPWHISVTLLTSHGFVCFVIFWTCFKNARVSVYWGRGRRLCPG